MGTYITDEIDRLLEPGLRKIAKSYGFDDLIVERVAILTVRVTIVICDGSSSRCCMSRDITIHSIDYVTDVVMQMCEEVKGRKYPKTLLDSEFLGREKLQGVIDKEVARLQGR